MKIEQTRLNNLKALIEEFGSQANVARKSDLPPSYLSQIITRKKSRTGKPRDLGRDAARKIEQGCGKPEGWMDVVHERMTEENNSEFIDSVRHEASDRDIPDHIQQAIMTMITSSPKKKKE